MNRTSRKRYILFKSTKRLTDEDRSRVAQMLGKEGPDSRTRMVVWLEDGLIVKSSVSEAADLRERLNRAEISGGRFSSVKSSGAIGKLKKLAAEGRDDEFGQVLR